MFSIQSGSITSSLAMLRQYISSFMRTMTSQTTPHYISALTIS